MTSTTPDAAPSDLVVPATAADVPTAPEATDEASTAQNANAKLSRTKVAMPVLEKLFELYPHLFGAEFSPLKLGVFQELMEKHPAEFERDALKTALSVHTRSTKYLQAVAAGKPRVDLQGVALEPVAPEHVCLTILELYRRRQGRSQEDLRPKVRRQIVAAFETSGLSAQEYQARVMGKDDDNNALVAEAFADYNAQLAKHEATARAFTASGKTVAEFADMYGLNPRDVGRSLETVRKAQAAAAAPAAQTEPAPVVEANANA